MRRGSPRASALCRPRCASLLALTGWVLLAPALGAQSAASPARQRQSEAETRAMREASTLEARGDHAGAERVLRALLQETPTAAGALFAIERSLRAQGRTKDVLTLADQLLVAEPRSSNVRTLKLRILVEVDSLETLEHEAQEWIRAEPTSSDPYRELARMYERAYGSERAVALLRDGRTRLGDASAFAVELGDLLERAGQPDAAAREWSLAIGNEGGQSAAVIRRIGQLPDSSRRVAELLLVALDGEPTTAARRVTAVRIALEISRPDDALRLGKRAVEQLEEPARRPLLEEVARRADELEAHALSLWAYETLRDLTTEGPEQRALHAKVAGAALAMGDTARALAARGRLAQSLPRGSVERRRVVAETLRLEAYRDDAETLGQKLSAFRAEFPDAPELDDLASSVAFGLQARGSTDAANAVLKDVSGPRSSLERAYLHLGQGNVEEAVVALQIAVESLPPTSATEVIQLVSLLGRVGPGAARTLGKAAVLAHRGSALQGVDHLANEVARLPDVDRASLLAHASRMADASDNPDRAAELRRRLLQEHPDAAETAEAALALARWNIRGGHLPEATRLLETLIVQRPTSPVVPDARRELDRIKARGPGGSP